MSWYFTTPPTPEEAARRLVQVRTDRTREHIKAVARQMREERGLPPLKALG